MVTESAPSLPPEVQSDFHVCHSEEFLCSNGRQCVPNSCLCDTWLDCTDGSDEYLCSKWELFNMLLLAHIITDKKTPLFSFAFLVHYEVNYKFPQSRGINKSPVYFFLFKTAIRFYIMSFFRNEYG